MRNYEVFATEKELVERIEDLRLDGFEDNEFQVITANELADTTLDYYDVDAEDGEPSLGDRISAFFTGENPDLVQFDDYDWDQEAKEDAIIALNHGEYILVVDRDDYYDDPRYFEDAISIDDPVHLNRNYDNEEFDHYNEDGEFVRTSYDDMAEDTTDVFEESYDDMESDDLL